MSGKRRILKMNRYCISESCIIIRDYMVTANSEEEAKEKFRSGDFDYLPNFFSEDVDGSHQIEDVELYEENIDD